MTTYSSFRPQTQNLVVSGATTLGDASNDVITINANPTLTAGTANGVPYLNGSKVLTTGSALTFDGAMLTVNRDAAGQGTATSIGSAAVRLDTSVGHGGNGVVTLNAYPTASPSTAAVIAWQLGGSEQMRLTSTGFGIGTSSPGNKLDVVGSVGIKSAGSLKLYNATNNSTSELSSDATGLTQFSHTGVTRWLNATATTETMRLDSSGNLGLGVTPSAWGTGIGITALQVRGISLLSINGNNSNETSNAYFNGSGWVYQFSDYATRYQQYAGTHAWFTAPSGTAGNAISFTQAMTLDASGNLGIPTSSPNAKLTLSGTNTSIRINDNAQSWFWITAQNSANMLSIGGTGSTVPTSGALNIDSSGNLLVGTTSTVATEGGFVWNTGGQIYVGHATGTSSGNYYAGFRYGSNTIGYISQNGTNAVTYATSSDYRLKENVQPMQNALAVVSQLNPVTYTWKADGSDGQGFIAHELQAVVPDCVTGEKDAVDEEGNPVYQGVDTSFLVATLTKAIQELKSLNDTQATTIASLEARLTALETK